VALSSDLAELLKPYFHPVHALLSSSVANLHVPRAKLSVDSRSCHRSVQFSSVIFERPLQVTVRSMLQDRCSAVCHVCLSATLVYRGQTAGWIKMSLGMEVGLSTGHIVSDGEP